MAEIAGFGMSHGPMLYMQPADMTMFLRRTLADPSLPDRLRDPANWPAAMRKEWGNDAGQTAALVHAARCRTANLAIRAQLDAFHPDLVLIFGDDQNENFTEDVIPPFCVYILDEMRSRPFRPMESYPEANVWNERVDTEFLHRGHSEGARHLAGFLTEHGFPVPYSYHLRYSRGLSHAFINTLMFLDMERRGFDYPVVPFHVNCYGGEFVRRRTPQRPGAAGEPPPPSPSTCFRAGALAARALAASPWRVAFIATSSWSHAFLVEKHHRLFPDHDSDQSLLQDLRAGHFRDWHALQRQRLEAAGQHEMLNWIALAGAMTEAGKGAKVIDYVETSVMTSNKCFAAFH
jgi:hypothetical protein